MLSYPLRITRTAEGRVRAIFPDVPEAIVEAQDEEEALHQAKFTLELSLGHYLIRGRKIPPPSDIADVPSVGTDKFSLSDGCADRHAYDLHPAPGGGRY